MCVWVWVFVECVFLLQFSVLRLVSGFPEATECRFGSMLFSLSLGLVFLKVFSNKNS